MRRNEKPATKKDLLAENEDLRQRLAEAEELLHAIRHGEVDALVVQTDHGDQVFTLQHAERPYRVIVETMNEGAVTLSVEGLILYCNERFERILSIRVGQVMGRSMHDFVLPDERDRLAAFLKTSLGAPAKDRFTLVAADGAAVPVYVSTSPVTAGDAGVICAVVTDMTELDVALKELRESETRYRTLVEFFPEAINVTVGGKIVYANPAALTLFGAERHQDLIGRSPIDLAPPDDRDSVLAMVQELDQGSRAAASLLETRILRLDGTAVDVETRAIRITYEGKPANLGVIRDITERKQAEADRQEAHAALARRTEQLRALAVQLAQAEERERRRIAHVLHDHLQQLLVGAKYSLGALAAHARDETIRPGLDQIRDLLDQSILASQSLTTELAPPVLYNRGLPEALKWLAWWMEEKHGIVVSVEADERPGEVAQDLRILLFQAVRELLFNVAKHAGVKSARVAMTNGPDRNLRITVFDQGKGFDAAAYIAGTTPGSFGLFNIGERLTVLDGRMEIESAPGQGTRVTLTVPIPQTVPSQPKDSKSPPKAKPMPPIPARSKIRVLVADDHAMVRKGLVEILKREPGVAVVGEAADGQQAVDQARLLVPDVVLMDVTMPRMSGIDATRILSAELPEVRVIGLSMHAQDDMAAKMRAAGAVRYLAKNVPIEDLVSTIREVCSTHDKNP